MFRYEYVAIRLYLGGGVLVALHTVKGLLGGIQGELGRVIATAQVEKRSGTPSHPSSAIYHSQETLSHVHDGLDGGGSGGFIDNGPAIRSDTEKQQCEHSCASHQTSCLWPATLAAGLKGSGRAVVADIARENGWRGSVGVDKGRRVTASEG